MGLFSHFNLRRAGVLTAVPLVLAGCADPYYDSYDPYYDGRSSHTQVTTGVIIGSGGYYGHRPSRPARPDWGWNGPARPNNNGWPPRPGNSGPQRPDGGNRPDGGAGPQRPDGGTRPDGGAGPQRPDSGATQPSPGAGNGGQRPQPDAAPRPEQNTAPAEGQKPPIIPGQQNP